MKTPLRRLRMTKLEQLQLSVSPYYRNFEDAIKSPDTLRSYRYALQDYMKYRKISDISSLLEGTTKELESELIAYLVSRKSQVSHSLRSLRLAAIKKFYVMYVMNDVILNWQKISCYLGEKKRVVNDDGQCYSMQQIQQILSQCDERTRVVILLLASTGMRVGGIPLLKIKNLTKIQEYNIYKIVVYEGSEEQYFTFCTPECTAAIESYLAYRERSGERLERDAPLIREQFDSKDLFAIKRPKHLVDSTIKNKVADVVVRSGVQQKEKLTESTTNKSGRIRKNIPMCHGFRKFTITKMAEADMNYEIRERLSGHTIGIAQRYLRFAEQKYIQEYLKAVDLLTINEENRLKKTVQELTTKTADNDYIIKTKLEEKDKELENLKHELVVMQKNQVHHTEEWENLRKEMAEVKKNLRVT
jgi:site-specific recombinase XerD